MATSELIKLRIRGTGNHIWVVPAITFPTKFRKHKFAVHKSIEIENNDWTATHVNTGLAVGNGKSQQEAIEAAKTQLQKVDAQQFESLIEKQLAKLTTPTIVDLLNVEQTEFGVNDFRKSPG